jgi:hypothetical protein
MAFNNYIDETVTDAGATITFGINNTIDTLVIRPDSSSITMLGNVAVNFSGTPNFGMQITVLWLGGFILNGNTFTINGVALTDLQALKEGQLTFAYLDGAAPIWINSYSPDWRNSETIDASVLQDESVTLAKLEDLTSANILLGNASNRPAEVAVTGDIAITNAGVTSIAAGVIVNADVNASAAIARAKLAAGTADQVVINDNTGVMTSEAQLATERGGTGQDTSADTGFPLVSAGTWSVGSITEVITLLVSFEAAGGTTPSVGDFKIKMPYAGVVTEIYAYAVKAISGTDNGTIVPKDNGGTTMTAGTITFTASDARGTAYTSTPSASNAFSAGDLLTFTTAKTTAGGLVQLSITVTRTS